MDEFSKRAFGKYIKKKREEKGFSREEFAKELNVSYEALTKWENGKRIPDFPTIGIISEKLGVSIQDIYDNSKYDSSNIHTIANIITIVLLSGVIILAIVLGVLWINKPRNEEIDNSHVGNTTEEETAAESIYTELESMSTDAESESFDVETTEEMTTIAQTEDDLVKRELAIKCILDKYGDFDIEGYVDKSYADKYKYIDSNGDYVQEISTEDLLELAYLHESRTEYIEISEFGEHNTGPDLKNFKAMAEKYNIYNELIHRGDFLETTRQACKREQVELDKENFLRDLLYAFSTDVDAEDSILIRMLPDDVFFGDLWFGENPRVDEENIYWEKFDSYNVVEHEFSLYQSRDLQSESIDVKFGTILYAMGTDRKNWIYFANEDNTIAGWAYVYTIEGIEGVLYIDTKDGVYSISRLFTEGVTIGVTQPLATVEQNRGEIIDNRIEIEAGKVYRRGFSSIAEIKEFLELNPDIAKTAAGEALRKIVESNNMPLDALELNKMYIYIFNTYLNTDDVDDIWIGDAADSDEESKLHLYVYLMDSGNDKRETHQYYYLRKGQICDDVKDEETYLITIPREK